MAKVNLISLGCDKNLVDSEIMLGLISEAGHTLTDDFANTDVFVINTCCFIQTAVEETIETVLNIAKQKTEGNCRGIVVTGCAAERYKKDFFEEICEVDALIGTSAIDKIPTAIDAAMKNEKYANFEANSKSDELYEKRIVSTPGTFSAYLKIAEGCDNFCTYCIIPKIRGKYKSRKIEDILKEADTLVKQGVVELNIIAQDTTVYGTDLYGEPKLAQLLSELSKIEGLKWMRLLYAYPEHITEEIINEIFLNKKVLHYIDMPIQHASNDILKRMNRSSSNEKLVEVISKLRERIPDICIRTTLITGFPGESGEDFNILCDFVSKMKFDRLGVFEYSQEEGTVAFDFPSQVDPDIKAKRKSIIMSLQKNISAEICRKEIGRTLSVIVEGRLSDAEGEEDIYCTRSYKDAPEVDGYVFVKCGYELISGSIINVTVTGAYDYDLIGEITDDESGE